MNRPDFILRQFEFYELTKSPHPIYISDSSNEENAQRIRDGIKQFKNLNITYQWAPPGKDCLYQLMPFVKEKYCVQIGDDDLVIPKTISKCADFLEDHTDYSTCAGKQVNIRFYEENYNKPYGSVGRQTRPFGRSVEIENLAARLKDFWSDPNFICFAVRRVEIEKKIRDFTKFFLIMDYWTEFIIWSTLIMSGKTKIIDKLGYIMQISDNRYNFSHDYTIDLLLAPATRAGWDICQDGLSKILEEKGVSKEESLKIAKWNGIFYLAKQFIREADSLPIIAAPNVGAEHIPTRASINPKISQKIRSFVSDRLFIRKIYYRIKYSSARVNIELKYLDDLKIVKDFLEKNR